MNKNQIVKEHSDEGILWFSCDDVSYEKNILDFETDNLIIMSGLIGVKTKDTLYRDGEEIVVELIKEQTELPIDFCFIGSVSMDTDCSEKINIGWLETLDENNSVSLKIEKFEKIKISFWINNDKDYIKVYIN